MATNTLHIRVRSDGTRVVGKNIKGIGESANLASRQVFIMRRAIQTLFAAIGVRAGFRAIEQFTELNNKLKTVTKTTKELISVRKKLLAISNDSRTALSATVQLYARTTRAVKSLGLSEAKRLKFTSLLTKEAVVGGATTIEATNAIRQLTQGMGAAGLKGEELRSVLEQLPTVAQRIAEFMGVAQSELRKLGEEGKLTGEVVVAAMLAAEESIEAAFGETTSTVGQSFEVLKNSFVEFVGNIDSFVSGTKAIAAGLQLVAQNLGLISTLLTGILARAAFVALANRGFTLASAIAFATTKVTAFVKALFLVKKAVPAMDAATAAFIAMTNARVTALAPAAPAAIPIVAGLSVPVILAIVAALAGLAAIFLVLSNRQNRYVTEVEKATEAEKKHKAAIDAKNRSLGLSFGGGEDRNPSDLVKKIEVSKQNPLERLKKELPKVAADLAEINSLMFKIQGNSLAIDLFRDTPSKKTQFDAAVKKGEELQNRLRELKAGLEELDIATTKDFSVTTVLKRAEAVASGLRGQFKFAEQAARGFLELMERAVDFELTKDELKGTEAQQQAAKIATVVTRLKELKDAYDENRISQERYDRGVAVNKEQLDKLTGGAVESTRALTEQNALFVKYGGDMEVIALKIAGATDEEIRAFREAKKAREELTEAQAAALAADKAAVTAERRNADAIQGTLGALREKIRLFGLVGRARQKAEFESLSPNKDQRAEFETSQNTLEQKGIAADIQSQIAELKKNTIAFAEAARLGKELAARSGKAAAEDISKTLIRGKDDLAKQAKAVAEAIAADLGTSGDKSIEEIRAALVAGAGTIGTQAGTALVTAFKAAVLGAVPGLTALLPPGVPGGEQSTDQQNAERETRNAEIDAASRGAQDATNKLLQLNDTARLFGPTMDASARQGSNALKGFGEEAITFGGELKNAFSSIFGSLEDALVGFVTTGKLDFKSLINSIIADLARMVIRMLIIKPLMGFFGGLFGGFFGFSGGGSVGGAFGLPGFAGGGLVNENPAVPQRFAVGGQVRGSGTGVSDSVPALLSRDEFVVNAAASRPNMAGLEYLNQTGRMPGGGSVTSVSYSPIVSVTVEGNSANAAGDGAQIAKDMEQQMRAQFNEFVSQEQRPGGAFSKTNEDVL